jgi:hypothetical protein
MPEEPEQTTELKSNGLASTDIIRLALRITERL